MLEFHCKCGWSWIITKKHVFGPINIQGLKPRIRNRKAWNIEDADCAHALKLYVSSTYGKD